MSNDSEPTRVPFIELIGACVEERSEGYGRLSLVIEQRHTNPHGMAHGGVATTLMDSAAAMALSGLKRARGRAAAAHATVEMNASLIAPARPGDELVVEGRVLRMGRSVAFVEAEVRRRSDDELIAKGRFTFAIRDRE